MEIGARVEAENVMTGEVRHTASAYLTFVALNEDRKPDLIPSLSLLTEDEKRRYNEAVERRNIRLAERNRENNTKI